MENISVFEYSQLLDVRNFDTILKHLKAKNKFLNKEVVITNLPYGVVKLVQKLLSNIKTFDDICNVYIKVFGVTKDEFYKANIEDFYSSRRYIFESFEKIQQNEIAMNKSTLVDQDKWKASGGDRLKFFDVALSVDSICERYGLYPFDVIEKPYHEVFYLQNMIKEYNEVNFNYNNQK